MRQIELTLTLAIPYDQNDAADTLRAINVEQNLRKELLNHTATFDGIVSAYAGSQMNRPVKDKVVK